MAALLATPPYMAESYCTTVCGKILANLAINANSPNFFPANTYKDTETTEDLPLDPNFPRHLLQR